MRNVPGFRSLGLATIAIGWIAQVSLWGQDSEQAATESPVAYPVEVRVFSLERPEQQREFPTALQALIGRIDPSQIEVQGGDEIADAAVGKTSPGSLDGALCLRLPEPEFAAFVREVTQHSDNNILLAPKLLLSPGQEGVVTSGATRPFVTGCRRIEGDFAAAYQPLVKAFFEGTRISVRLSPGQTNELHVATKFEASRIEHVAQVSLPTDPQAKVARESAGNYTSAEDPVLNNKPAGAMTIQIPSVVMLTKHADSVLLPGETLLVSLGPWSQPRRVEKGVPIPGGDRLFKRVVVDEEQIWLAMAITPRRADAAVQPKTP